MRKGTWPAATLVLLLSGAGVLLGGHRVEAADGRVGIVDADSDALKWRFDPADVTVTAGSAVVWHNGGSQTHTVTADDGKFESGDVKPNADYQWKPSVAGDFAYHCTPHPWMKGVVHVVAASTPATAPSATPATQPSSSGTPATTTTTSKPGASSTTTTTAKAGASASTTTTAAAASGSAAAATTTTTAAAAAATSAGAPDAAATTTTTSASGAEERAAGAGGKSHGGKTNPVLVTLAGLLTLALAGISAKLLAAKS